MFMMVKLDAWPTVINPSGGAFLGAGLMSSLPVLIILWVIWRRDSGNSPPLPVFLFSCVSTSGALGMIAWMGGLCFNGLADRSPPTVRSVTVFGWTCKGGIRHDEYEVRTKSWVPEQTMIHLSISPKICGQLRSLQPPAVLDVTTHPGRLGWEWYSEVVVHADPQILP